MYSKNKFQKLVSMLFIVATLLSSFHSPAVSALGNDGLKRQVNAETGKVSFISPENGHMLSASKALGTFIRPQDPALALAKRFAPEFGIKNPERDLSEMKKHQSDDGRLMVRYQQKYQGIPVMGGELIVNTNGNGDLYSMSGEVSQDLTLQTQPKIDAAQAAQTALQALAKWYQKTPADFNVSEPELWIFDESLLKPSTRPVELVWRMEVTPKELGMPVRELVLVNAERGNISLHFNQVDTAWTGANTSNHDQTLPAEVASPSDSDVIDNPVTDPITTENMPALAPVNWYVATTGHDSNSCTSPASPCLTINGAIGKAANGDTIKVAIGTYYGTGNSVVFTIKDILLSGGWNAVFDAQTGMSTIDGQGVRTGIQAFSITTIEYFIVQNGNATAASNYHGGGISAVQNTFTVRHSIIRNNTALSAGGGIWAEHLSIIDSALYGNSSTLNDTFTGRGGGVYSEYNLNMTNSTIYDNWAAQKGGGIYAGSASTAINNSTIVNNYATEGGGITIYISGAVVNIRNSIMANNTASFGPDCRGEINISDHNIIENVGCSVASNIGSQFGVDPILSANPYGSPEYFAIRPGSPAFDTGNSASCAATDQRGTTRPAGASCDIGAFEYQGDGTIPAQMYYLAGSFQATTTSLAFPQSLKAVIIDAEGDGVPGQTVTFTGPASGTSIVFQNTGTSTSTAVTDASGVATSSTLSANSKQGTFIISATTVGLGTSIDYLLTTSNAKAKTYTAYNTTNLPGTLLCEQTNYGCTGGIYPHADGAHKYAIGTYAMYADKHGRDSLDNAGMTIISTVHYDLGYDNAFWDGTQAVYGDASGWPLADDVVAHELTHGVTERESNLFYFYQSGAINESFSDLWGEYYDQTNGLGSDAVNFKWLVSEDIGIGGSGAIRSMSNPPTYGDPDRMTSSLYYNGDGDNGGVHYNSGINNKAVYLMVDGGSFNGKTVIGLGWDKTAAIYYEVNTNLFTSGSNYSDLYYALQEACQDLVGQFGLVAGDCDQVKNALDAVEMNAPAYGGFYPDAPVCAAGQSPTALFQDNFENGTGNWDILGSAQWYWEDWYATSPTHMMWGDDYASSSDSQLAMKNGVYLAPGTTPYLHFRHAFLFENDYSTYYDGGVLEYSTNNGATWLDASAMFSTGKNYTAVLELGTSNALNGRWAFAGDSHGYISSKYNLSSLVGQTVKFRWRFGTDQYVYFLGWTVDDVKIYTCAADAVAPTVTSITHPVSSNPNLLTTDFLVTFSESVTGVSKNDFALTTTGVTGASVASVSGTGTTYTVTVHTGVGNGTIRVDVVDNDSIKDGAGNFLGGAGTGNGNFTGGEVFVLNKTAEVFIGEAIVGGYALASGQEQRENYPVSGGPVVVKSLNAAGMVAAIRLQSFANNTLYSFAETMGVPEGLLSHKYYFPSYNNIWAPLNSQLRFANLEADPTTVKVTIGGNVVWQDVVQGQEEKRLNFNVSGGPVIIESLDSSKQIVAAIRLQSFANDTLYNFAETMGVPFEQLSHKYYFPSYNNIWAPLNSQLRFANLDANPTTVRVTIGSSQWDYVVPGMTERRETVPVSGGPVIIESLDTSKKIVAAIRLQSFANNTLYSFVETMGVPSGLLSHKYYFPSYNNIWAPLNSQIRFASLDADPTTVRVTIGASQWDYVVPGMTERRETFTVSGGPVIVESLDTSKKIVAAIRLQSFANNTLYSFAETMGIPFEHLSDTYYFPSYNNIWPFLNSQLRFAVP